MNLKTFISVLIAAIGASFFAGYATRKERVVYVDVPRTVIDTCYVKKETVKIVHAKAKHDTLKVPVTITKHDTVFSDQVSHYDVTLISDGLKYGDLGISYYPKPCDWFNVQFNPAPLPVITETKFLYEKKPWYANPFFTFTAGALLCATAQSLNK